MTQEFPFNPLTRIINSTTPISPPAKIRSIRGLISVVL